MDDLLREFLTETSESLDTVDNQLVRFEQEPNNAKILDNIFRLVHTIKGTCGFLGLPRLEALAHAAETLMGKFRDGMPVTGQAVTLILTTIDRIKDILSQLEATEAEPEGNDQDLIGELEAMVERGMADMEGSAQSVAEAVPADAPPAEPAATQGATEGSLVAQTLERPLRPGEVSLDELERAFRETSIEVAPAHETAPAPAPAPAQPQATAQPRPAAANTTDKTTDKTADKTAYKTAEKNTEKAAAEAAAKTAAAKSPGDSDAPESDRVANQSIRVNVEMEEHTS